MADYGTRTIKNAKTGKITKETITKNPDQRTQAQKNTDANAPIFAQIVGKEAEAIRSQRELMREQHFPGDLSASDKAFAQNKVRQIDRDIVDLRALLV